MFLFYDRVYLLSEIDLYVTFTLEMFSSIERFYLLCNMFIFDLITNRAILLTPSTISSKSFRVFSNLSIYIFILLFIYSIINNI